MIEYKKEPGIKDIIKDGLSYISKIALANLYSSIAEGTEIVMNIMEKRIIRIKKRILRDVYSLLIISLGNIFLIFGLFFFLIENLKWTKMASFFFIGIIILLTGLFFRLTKSNK